MLILFSLRFVFAFDVKNVNCFLKTKKKTFNFVVLNNFVVVASSVVVVASSVVVVVNCNKNINIYNNHNSRKNIAITAETITYLTTTVKKQPASHFCLVGRRKARFGSSVVWPC